MAAIEAGSIPIEIMPHSAVLDCNTRFDNVTVFHTPVENVSEILEHTVFEENRNPDFGFTRPAPLVPTCYSVLDEFAFFELDITPARGLWCKTTQRLFLMSVTAGMGCDSTQQKKITCGRCVHMRLRAARGGRGFTGTQHNIDPLVYLRSGGHYAL